MTAKIWYLQIQHELRLRGSNLTAAAKILGTTRQNLYNACVGNWEGPKAKALVKKIGELLDTPPPPDKQEEVTKEA